MTLAVRRAVALIVLAVLGCRVGTKVEDFPAAHGPEGVAVRLRVAAPQLVAMELSGELLAVEDTALLVREAPRGVVRVPFREILNASFRGMGGAGLGGGRRTVSPAQLARLRLVSRFPQGVSPDLLQKLLALDGQAEVQRAVP